MTSVPLRRYVLQNDTNILHRVHRLETKESVLAALRSKHHFPLGKWGVKEVDKDSRLILLHDKFYEHRDGIIPSRYSFAKCSVFDADSFKCVCEPLKVHHTFLIPEYPESDVTIYSKENKDSNDGYFEEHERTAQLSLDPSDVCLEYCYEGKYLRVMRYRGRNHIMASRNLNMNKCRENDIAYSDMLKQTGVDVETLFDQSVECSEVILHLLLGFPTGCVKTRRPVAGPYLVLLYTEKMDPSILAAHSHAPLVEPTFTSLLYRDRVDSALGSVSGKLLLPAKVSREEAPKRLNGYDGEYLIVRDPRSRRVLGRICSIEAGLIRRLKPEGISGRSIAIECLMRSSTKNREKMIQDNNLPLLLNFRQVPLEQFAENPQLEPLCGDDIASEENMNWELLSSVCYLYLPDMRKCIAQNALAIQMEVCRLRDMCLGMGFPIDEKAYSGQDFNFERVLSTVRTIYEDASLYDAKSEMKMRAPMLYNLMKPPGEDKAPDTSYLLPRYDAGTYESRGCPQVVRRN